MKVTLITGASSGIGEAIARQLAAKKHNLLLVARSENKLKQLCSELSDKENITAQYIAADLTKPDTANLVYRETQKRNLTVSVLINNAGIGSTGEFVQNNLQSEADMMYLNNTAMVSLCHLFLSEMKKAKSGTIINVASVAAFFPSPYMAVYAATKAFVRSFTQALTEECRPYGVHVMLFSPGLTSSNFMNTQATDNDWGKVLTDGANIQSSEQVAKEMMRALEKKKASHISGHINAASIKVGSIIPQATIARLFARSKRKRMNF